MPPLRTPSARPTVTIDEDRTRVVDNARITPGWPGPLGRERVLFTLPLEPGPALLEPMLVLRDESVNNAADPAPLIVGWPAVRVARMLTATVTQDTKRLS
jgi:hypothetical protein